jgi:hypothetical protein
MQFNQRRRVRDDALEHGGVAAVVKKQGPHVAPEGGFLRQSRRKALCGPDIPQFGV